MMIVSMRVNVEKILGYWVTASGNRDGSSGCHEGFVSSLVGNF